MLLHKNNLNKMMGLDIYLSALSNEEYQHLKGVVKQLNYTPHPLMCWDLTCMQQAKFNIKTAKNKDLKTLEAWQQKFNWNFNIQKTLANNYFVLVLTDSSLSIKWVNENFTKMTGYSKKYAVGKTPNFLQGARTSENSRVKIKSQLHEKEFFTEVVTNYKKNKEEYLCEISIFSIRNNQNKITHFLALEKEIYDNRR